MSKRYITTRRSFINGSLAPKGTIVEVADGMKVGKNLRPVEGTDLNKPVVAMAPIAPTGPRPTQPQQIPHDAVQTAAGTYVQPDAKLVGAGHSSLMDDDGNIDETQTGATQEEFRELMGDGEANKPVDAYSDELDGTVDEIAETLGGKTDDELEALRTAEVNGKSRKGVLNAIKAEQEGRKA